MCVCWGGGKLNVNASRYDQGFSTCSTDEYTAIEEWKHFQ